MLLQLVYFVGGEDFEFATVTEGSFDEKMDLWDIRLTERIQWLIELSCFSTYLYWILNIK